MKHSGKQSFADYWMTNPDERQRGVVYKRAKNLYGVKYPYMVSSEGVVRNMYNNNIIKQHTTDKGYKRVHLYLHNGDPKPWKILVHRLVMISFGKLTNPDDVVNHKDFDPKNNSLENLELTTTQGNVSYSYKAGRMKVPRKNNKKYEDLAERICRDYLSVGGMTFDEIAKECGCSIDNVRRIYKGELRQDISSKYDLKPPYYFSISTESAVKVCEILENYPGIDDKYVAKVAKTIPEFVKGIREGKYRKDISHGRVLNPVKTSDIQADEDVRKMVYCGREFNMYLTNTGRVIRGDGSEVIPKINTDGFYSVNAKTTDGYNTPVTLHMAMAETFVPNPNPDWLSCVGFKDLNRYNCNANNLIWLTESEYRGLTAKDPDKQLTLDKAHLACKLIAAGLSNVAIAKQTQLTTYMVNSIREKRKIRWISDQYFGNDVKRIGKTGKRMKGNKRFTESDILNMLDMYNHGIKPSNIAEKYETSREQVNNIVSGRQHADIKAKFDKTKNLVILCGREPHARKINW